MLIERTWIALAIAAVAALVIALIITAVVALSVRAVGRRRRWPNALVRRARTPLRAMRPRPPAAERRSRLAKRERFTA